jgi:hypothetical protein
VADDERIKVLRSLCERIKYKTNFDFGIELSPYLDHTPLLWIQYKADCLVSNCRACAEGRHEGRFERTTFVPDWVLESNDETTIVQWMFLQFLSVEAHEAAEAFHVDDTTPFDPPHRERNDVDLYRVIVWV